MLSLSLKVIHLFQPFSTGFCWSIWKFILSHSFRFFSSFKNLYFAFQYTWAHRSYSLKNMFCPLERLKTQNTSRIWMTNGSSVVPKRCIWFVFGMNFNFHYWEWSIARQRPQIFIQSEINIACGWLGEVKKWLKS